MQYQLVHKVILHSSFFILHLFDVVDGHVHTCTKLLGA